jgi:RHS repeat-associated protein
MQDPRLVATGSSYAYAYTYDLMGRKTRMAYPPDAGGALRSEWFAYDTAGNPLTYTNRAGAVQTFTYDGRNRHTTSTWSDGTTAPTIAYDPASRVTQISNAHAVINNTYFNDNKPKTQEEWATAAPSYHRTVTYAYDADGNRGNIIYPSGKNYSYGYNGRNDLWYVLDNLTGIYQAAYVYDVNGNVTTRYVGNNWIITDASQRNPLNQIKHLEHRFAAASAAPTTRTFDYTYNSMGSRISIRRDGGAVENYGYDLSQEVTAGIENGGAASYGYDANGNRTALNGGGVYATNGLNQQTTFHGQLVGHDSKGNVSSYGSAASYVYDAQNRLTSVTSNGITSTFKHDGLNRKISQTIAGVTTYNVWDGWNLIEERNTSNTLLNTYLYGAGEVIERITGTTNRFYFQDGLGSTSHFSEEGGTLLESYQYGTFGQQTVYAPNGTVRTGGTAYDIRHLFTGQLWMPQAGLYDYRNRAYSPTLTRFLQPDPIGFAGGDANLYRYCGNNPVNWSDPTGTTVRFSGDRAAINSAINYLSGSPTFSSIYSGLHSSSRVYTITTNYSFPNGSFGPLVGSGGVIVWNPSLGLWVTSAQGIQSAAMVLAHELAGHAHNWDTNPGKYEGDSDTDAGVYDNMEEYYAGQTETEIAEELGEPTRQDHRGQIVFMTSPTEFVTFSASYTRYYLMGEAQFGAGWGTGSGLNPGSFGGASADAVAAAGLYLSFMGGGQPGEGFHPVPLHLR